MKEGVELRKKSEFDRILGSTERKQNLDLIWVFYHVIQILQALKN